MQRFQLDCGVFQRGDEIKGALLVLQEQVLGVAARDHAPERLGLLDREQWLMADGGVGDPEAVEIGEKLGRRHWHAFFIALEGLFRMPEPGSEGVVAKGGPFWL